MATNFDDYAKGGEIVAFPIFPHDEHSPPTSVLPLSIVEKIKRSRKNEGN